MAGLQKRATLGRILLKRGGTQIDSQKILLDWGGTHFLIFQRDSTTFLKKTNSQKILLDWGGTQIDSHIILVKWGGTRFDTF
jgi:hypothetical protein